MKLTFLGTGTSTGVPLMRCHCPTCTSSDPHDKRLRTSALLQTEPGAPAILLDCGPDFRQQMLALDSPDLCCALLTHSHYDHVGGIDDLRPYAYFAPGHRFPLYCPPDVEQDLRDRIPYCFREHPYPGVPQFTIVNPVPYVPFTISPGEDFRPVTVTALTVMHGQLPIYGYRIDNMAYITDCLTLPRETMEQIRGLDTLVINALRIEKHATHQNLKEALDVIKESAPRQAYLIHMGHDMGLHRDVAAMLPEGVTMAYDGLTVDIPTGR